MTKYLIIFLFGLISCSSVDEKTRRSNSKDVSFRYSVENKKKEFENQFLVNFVDSLHENLNYKVSAPIMINGTKGNELKHVILLDTDIENIIFSQKNEAFEQLFFSKWTTDSWNVNLILRCNYRISSFDMFNLAPKKIESWSQEHMERDSLFWVSFFKTI